MSHESRTRRWRLAALLSSVLALVLGFANWRASRTARPVSEPSLPRANAPANPRSEPATEVSPADALLPSERGVPALLAALVRTTDSRQRSKLVTALGETADETALDSLFDWVTRGEDDVPQAALLGIAKIGGVRAREFLEQRFRDGREAELVSVAAALATLGGDEARDFLRKAAQSTRSGARDAALGALSMVDSPDVRAFMLSELRGTAPSAATAYFGDCVEPNALPALERLAQSSESELRGQAVSALVAQGPSAEASLTALLRGEAETADAVLEAAKGVLGLRPVLRASSIARLRAGAVTSGSAFTYLTEDLSREARIALVEAAHDPGSASSAISALASRGDPASLQALNELSRDRDPEIAARALCAQFRNPDSRARSTLLALRGDDTRAAAITALASIAAPEAEAGIAALSRSDQANERREAAVLLGKFGPRDAEYELRELAQDAEYQVVSASLSALARLGADSVLRELAARGDSPSFLRDYAASLLDNEPTRYPRHPRRYPR